MIHNDLAHTYEPIGPEPVDHALIRVSVIAGATAIFWFLIIGIGVIFYG